MSYELAFWIVMLLWAFLGIGGAVRRPADRPVLAWAFPVFLLFLILGLDKWHSPLHG